MAARGRLAGAAAVLIALSAQPVHAGAWPTPKGQGQVIIKAEAMRASQGFDPIGDLAPLPGDQIDRVVGLFLEYGLNDRLTFQFKGDWQDGEDAFQSYSGRGPAEVGLRAMVWSDGWSVLSVYAGHAFGGDARNAVYAAPGDGEGDWDLRVLAGRSFQRHGAFVEAQAARRLRRGLSDETRLDLTVGARPAPGWLVMTQVFSGAADEGPRWADLETSVVRELGGWSFQAGWRQRIYGREAPESGGPVAAVWRRF